MRCVKASGFLPCWLRRQPRWHPPRARRQTRTTLARRARACLASEHPRSPVTPAADPGAAATASATVAGSQPQQNSQPENSRLQNSQRRSTVRHRLSHRRRWSTSQRPTLPACRCPGSPSSTMRAGTPRWTAYSARRTRPRWGVNTHDCSPHAAGAHFCWSTTGTVALVCSWDPRSTELHRYGTADRHRSPRPTRSRGAWAWPMAGSAACAWAGRLPAAPTTAPPPTPATARQRPMFLGDSTDPVVDTSGPQWIVKVGGASTNPTVTSLPPPVAIGVVTAYVAVTG